LSPLKGWAIPSRAALPMLLPILLIGFSLLCLALAPNVRYCHLLLMNPFLRKWISFGTVPLLLTVLPPMRKYLFRRYCTAVAQDPRFRLAASLYIVPNERFQPSTFGTLL